MKIETSTEAGGAPQSNALLSHALELTALLKMGIPSPEFVVAPFFPLGGSGILYSAPGLGKTWLAHHLALCVSAGIPWLGFEVPKARSVLLVDGELALPLLQERLRAVAAFSPTERKPLQVLCAESLVRTRGRPLRLSAASDRSALVDEIRSQPDEARPKLVILDNLSALWPGLDENSNGEVSSEVNAWISELRYAGCAVLLIHHSSKGTSGAGPRGASALSAPVDFVIGLVSKSGRSGHRVTLQFEKQRHEPVPASAIAVELSPEAEGMRILLEGTADTETLRLLGAIANHGDSSRRKLARELEMPGTTFLRRVKRACTDGYLLPDLRLTAKGKALLRDWAAPY